MPATKASPRLALHAQKMKTYSAYVVSDWRMIPGYPHVASITSHSHRPAASASSGAHGYAPMSADLAARVRPL